MSLVSSLPVEPDRHVGALRPMLRRMRPNPSTESGTSGALSCAPFFPRNDQESDDRGREIQDLFDGQEFRIELGHLWSGAESTAEKDSESAPAFACCRPKADVVNSQCGVIFGAPFESDLD